MKKMAVLLLSVSFLVLFASNNAVKSESVSNTHNYAYVGPQGPPILPPV
ncbi:MULTISPECIES: hypothetical protein [unclassified Bacillus (in: firmicutes)]|nr:MULTISPECIES: hypothetical protein [unclassified Bacillus (in: firmicutes)]